MKRGVMTTLVRAQENARELFAWWWGELRDIGTSLMNRLPSRQSPQTFIRVVAGAISIEQREADQWKVVGTVPAANDGSWPEELPGLPAELTDSRAAILLPESELFFHEFELPMAAERHLTSVLRLQLERALPVAMDQVLFDRQIVGRDRDHDMLTVRIAAAHRERIEQLRELATRWKLVPVGAGVVGTNGAFTFNFLKRRRDPLRWRPSPLDRQLIRAGAASVALLLSVIGVSWMRERSIVGEQAGELHAQATKIADERTRVVREAEPLLALQSIANTRDAPAVLAALSAAVPVSAWFSQVEIIAHVDQPGRLRLTGAVNSREEVVAALRALPGVSNLQTNSAFNGQILGPETVEFTADFAASPAKAAAL